MRRGDDHGAVESFLQHSQYRYGRSFVIVQFLFLLLNLAARQGNGFHQNYAAGQKSKNPSQRFGGYFDETKTNVDPNLPIQFYTLKGGMCPYAARTHMTLLELGFDFETIEVPQGRPDWYLNINPRGKVPALQIPSDGNAIIYESAICNEYLCDRHCFSCRTAGDGSALMPESPLLRARIRLLNDHYDTVVGPAQFTFLMNKTPEKDSELAQALEESLDVYENALASTGGPFLMGETFTLADIHFLPFFYRLVVSLSHYKGYRLDPQRFRRLLVWYNEVCSGRESVRAATPSEERVVEVYKMFVERDYAFGGLNKNV